MKFPAVAMVAGLVTATTAASFIGGDGISAKEAGVPTGQSASEKGTQKPFSAYSSEIILDEWFEIYDPHITHMTPAMHRDNSGSPREKAMNGTDATANLAKLDSDH